MSTSEAAPGYASHPAFSEPLTREDWRAYVDYRLPAPPTLLTAAARRALSPAAQEELLERRLDYHSALAVVTTPVMEQAHKAMKDLMRLNRTPRGAGRGLIIDGQGATGKSTILKTFGRDYERELRRRQPSLFEWEHPGEKVNYAFTPVVYLSIPAAATPKQLSEKLGAFLGVIWKPAATTPTITDAVIHALKQCGTRLILIDDVHFLDCSHRGGRMANDHLKYLANYCPATFVYAGVGLRASGLFGEGTNSSKTQTSGRFQRMEVNPFAQRVLARAGSNAPITEEIAAEWDQWTGVVAALESCLQLYRHTPGTLVGLADYLLARTDGVIASLSTLICLAALRAIDDGSEAITWESLEEVVLDMTAEAQYAGRKKSRTRSAS